MKAVEVKGLDVIRDYSKDIGGIRRRDKDRLGGKGVSKDGGVDSRAVRE